MNQVKMEEVLSYLDEHPDELDMMAWSPSNNVCGTAMCVAGHTAVLNGAQFLFEGSYRVRTPRGDVVNVDDYASDVLGLTTRQADDLFYAVEIRTPAQIRAYVERMIEEEYR